MYFILWLILLHNLGEPVFLFRSRNRARPANTLQISDGSVSIAATMLEKLPQAQRDLLVEYINDYFETIRDYDTADWGTKICYLTRSISQNCQVFLCSLDKLYLPNLENGVRARHIDFLNCLKKINDLYFNHTVRASWGGEFYESTEKDALTHYFSSFAQEVDVEKLQNAIQAMIVENIMLLRSAHPEYLMQQEDRIIAEATIVRQPAWRRECQLPDEQLEDEASTGYAPRTGSTASWPTVRSRSNSGLLWPFETDLNQVLGSNANTLPSREQI